MQNITENHKNLLRTIFKGNWSLEVSTFTDLEAKIKEGLQTQICSLVLPITHLFDNIT